MNQFGYKIWIRSNQRIFLPDIITAHFMKFIGRVLYDNLFGSKYVC